MQHQPRRGRAAPKGGGNAAGRSKVVEGAAAEPEPEAAQALVPELAAMKAAIQRVHGTEVADMFTPDTLKLLWDELYMREAALETANRQTLLAKGLPGGLVDALTKPDNAGECWASHGYRQQQHKRACRVMQGSHSPDAGVRRCCSGRSRSWVLL